MFEIAEISNFTEDELRNYEAVMKYADVYNATIAYAKRESFGEGVTQKALKTARNLKAMGLSVAKIAKATELTKAEVLALK